jgi:hypothetical protein
MSFYRDRGYGQRLGDSSVGSSRSGPPASERSFDGTTDWVAGLLTLQRPRRIVRRFTDVSKDPFCTNQSFHSSGNYRPTAYAPRDRSEVTNVVPRRDPRRGPYTGAARPDHPRVNRKFGNNTRSSVMPFRRYTHMREDGYDDDVVGSERLPSFLNPNAAIGQGGSEAVLAAAHLTRTLGPGRPGSRHILLDG